MSRHIPNSQLFSLLGEAGWSAGQLARAINALGHAQGLDLRYDRTSVAHWLSGSQPRSPVPILAAQALSNRTGRLVTAKDIGLLGSPQTPPSPSLTGPGNASVLMRHLVDLCRHDTDPARRASLTRTVYVVGAIDLPKQPDRAAARILLLASSAEAQAMREMTHVFATLAIRHGGAHARSALACYLSDDVARLLVSPPAGRLNQHVLSHAAQLTHLLASMTADTGQQGLAQRYYRIALNVALEAGDLTTYAITLRAMSTQALRLGHPRHAGDLVVGALDTLGLAATPATHAFLLAQRALTHATVGRSKPALADLAAAEEQHHRDAGQPGPFTAYPRAGLDYQRGKVFQALHRPTEAVAAFQDAVRHRSPQQRKSYALAQACLAGALVQTGHLDAACSHWHTFLDHYPHLRSVQADQALAHLHRLLSSFPRQHQALSVRERAHALRHARLRP